MAAYIGVEHQFLPGDDHLPQESIAEAAGVVEQVVEGGELVFTA